jgi:hypothetical protein
MSATNAFGAVDLDKVSAIPKNSRISDCLYTLYRFTEGEEGWGRAVRLYGLRERAMANGDEWMAGGASATRTRTQRDSVVYMPFSISERYL